MSRRTSFLVVVALLGAGALWWWYSWHHPAGWSPALSSREIATRVLAEQLVRHRPGAKALVIGNPFVERSGQSAEIYAFERASIAGLEHGFGTMESLRVVHPALKPEFLQHPESVAIDPKTTTPLSYLIVEDAFDRVVQTNGGFDFLISLIGVPPRVRESKVWQDPKSPALALLFPDWRLMGSSPVIREAFNSGKLAAAVLNRPGVSGNPTAIEREYRAEFERRFLLVTKENVDELMRAFPQLF